MAEQEREALAGFVAKHRPNVVTEEVGPLPVRWRTRIKCDGGSCDFYAEGERYWDVVKVHDAHLAEVLASRDAALIAEAVDAALTEAADRIDAWMRRNYTDGAAIGAEAARQAVEGLRDERRGT